MAESCAAYLLTFSKAAPFELTIAEVVFALTAKRRKYEFRVSHSNWYDGTISLYRNFNACNHTPAVLMSTNWNRPNFFSPLEYIKFHIKKPFIQFFIIFPFFSSLSIALSSSFVNKIFKFDFYRKKKASKKRDHMQRSQNHYNNKFAKMSQIKIKVAKI